MALPSPLPKMMIGFVVRRCTVALGHDPTPSEFAEWANEYDEDGRIVCLFGRAITVDEARLILKHRARPVSARSAAAHEVLAEVGEPLRASNVSSMADARERFAKRAKARN